MSPKREKKTLRSLASRMRSPSRTVARTGSTRAPTGEITLHVPLRRRSEQDVEKVWVQLRNLLLFYVVCCGFSKVIDG